MRNEHERADARRDGVRAQGHGTPGDGQQVVRDDGEQRRAEAREEAGSPDEPDLAHQSSLGHEVGRSESVGAGGVDEEIPQGHGSRGGLPADSAQRGAAHPEPQAEDQDGVQRDLDAHGQDPHHGRETDAALGAHQTRETRGGDGAQQQDQRVVVGQGRDLRGRPEQAHEGVEQDDAQPAGDDGHDPVGRERRPGHRGGATEVGGPQRARQHGRPARAHRRRHGPDEEQDRRRHIDRGEGVRARPVRHEPGVGQGVDAVGADRDGRLGGR